jgi:hypothetical protein
MPRQHGRTIDFAMGINPVADLAAGANTGKRVHLRNYDTLGVLFFKNAASAGTDTVTLTLQEHNAASAGTSQNLAAITDWYYKTAAGTLAGTEKWVEATQAAAATLALADAGPVKAANQAIVAFEIGAEMLSAGFQWVSVNIADPGAGGTILGGLFYFMGGLKIQRRPDLLAQPNA